MHDLCYLQAGFTFGAAQGPSPRFYALDIHVVARYPSPDMSKSAVDAKKFDVRLIQRNLKNKSITMKTYDAHLDALPDVATKSITLGEVEDSRAAQIGDS